MIEKHIKHKFERAVEHEEKKETWTELENKVERNQTQHELESTAERSMSSGASSSASVAAAPAWNRTRCGKRKSPEFIIKNDAAVYVEQKI